MLPSLTSHQLHGSMSNLAQFQIPGLPQFEGLPPYQMPPLPQNQMSRPPQDIAPPPRQIQRRGGQGRVYSSIRDSVRDEVDSGRLRIFNTSTHKPDTFTGEPINRLTGLPEHGNTLILGVSLVHYHGNDPSISARIASAWAMNSSSKKGYGLTIHEVPHYVSEANPTLLSNHAYDFGMQRSLAIRRPDEKRLCANCDSAKHTLDSCPGPPAPKYLDIYGCGACNTKNHCVDNCHRAKDRTDRDLFLALVVKRGNMPQLRTNIDIKKLIQDHPDWYAEFSVAPWTREFTAQQLSSRPWERLKDMEMTPLEMTKAMPVDPNMAYFEKIIACPSFFSFVVFAPHDLQYGPTHSQQSSVQPSVQQSTQQRPDQEMPDANPIAPQESPNPAGHGVIPKANSSDMTMPSGAQPANPVVPQGATNEDGLALRQLNARAGGQTPGQTNLVTPGGAVPNSQAYSDIYTMRMPVPPNPTAELPRTFGDNHGNANISGFNVEGLTEHLSLAPPTPLTFSGMPSSYQEIKGLKKKPQEKHS